MRLRTAAVAIVVAAGAAVCVRLGLWQLARLHEKQRLNAALDRDLAAAPSPVTAATLADSLLGRRVRLQGRYDESRQALLSGLLHEGEPGVHVLTPFVLLGGGGTVLVDRGWIPAPDAVSGHPGDYPQPGLRRVVGIADAPARAAEPAGARMLEADRATLVSIARVDLDTLSVRLGVALAPFYVRELPARGLRSPPIREAPLRHEEFMHLSYAVQWFAFAAILLVGSSALAWSRRDRGSKS